MSQPYLDSPRHGVPSPPRFTAALETLFNTLGVTTEGLPRYLNAVLPRAADDPAVVVATPVFRLRPWTWGQNPDPTIAPNFVFFAVNPLRASWRRTIDRDPAADRQINDGEIDTITARCLSSMPDGWSPGFKIYQRRLAIQSVVTRRTHADAQFLLLGTDLGDHVVFDARLFPCCAPGLAISCNLRPARSPREVPVIIAADPNGPVA